MTRHRRVRARAKQRAESDQNGWRRKVRPAGVGGVIIFDSRLGAERARQLIWTRAKRTAPMAKVFSKETRAKMSASARLRANTAEGRLAVRKARKMSMGNKGGGNRTGLIKYKEQVTTPVTDEQFTFLATVMRTGCLPSLAAALRQCIDQARDAYENFKDPDAGTENSIHEI
jgi:hypothetical protein